MTFYFFFSMAENIVHRIRLEIIEFSHSEYFVFSFGKR